MIQEMDNETLRRWKECTWKIEIKSEIKLITNGKKSLPEKKQIKQLGRLQEIQQASELIPRENRQRHVLRNQRQQLQRHKPNFKREKELNQNKHDWNWNNKKGHQCDKNYWKTQD